MRTGTDAVRRGRPEVGIADLRAALNLCAAPRRRLRLRGVRQPHVARLNELRLGALEELAAAELAVGHVRERLDQRRGRRQEDPLRERGRQLAMVALYQAGRHVDAIRSYEGYRRMLADDLGIVPSPPLQRLHERILLHDPALAAEANSPVRSIGVRHGTVQGPAPFRADDADDFFGRDVLVAPHARRGA